MTALELFAAMPLHLVLLIARFAGAKSAPPAEKTTVASVFGVSGLRPEPLPGLGAWGQGAYGDF